MKAASPGLHGTIREALVSIAPSFACIEHGSKDSFILKPQQNLLLAMLKDNTDSENLVVLGATFQFLTVCFPAYFAPSRILMLIIAGKRNALYETIMISLYGSSKKDNINYNMITSTDSKELDSMKIVLPSFKEIIAQVYEVIEKRSEHINQEGFKIPFNNNTFEEVNSIVISNLNYFFMCKTLFPR